jgi:hypothetical protein
MALTNITFAEQKRNGTLLHVRSDVSGVERLALAVGLNAKNIDQAKRRAVRKLGLWLRRQTLREVSRDKQVQMKALRQRFAVYMDPRFGSFAVKAWFGLNALPYDRVGKPRQTARGVRAGKHFLEGAFLASPKLFGAAPTTPGVWMRKGKERMPIFKPRLEIAEDFAASLDKVFPHAHKKLQTLLQQEIKYELLKVGGHA